MSFQWSKIAKNPAPVNLGAGRPATGDDLRQLAELDGLDESELDRVRSAADKWKTGLAALLGLIATVSVVKGRESFSDLTLRTQHRIIVVLGLALATATLAALLSMRAAYGPLRRQLLNPNEQLRTLRLTAAEGARRDLRYARLLTLLTLALLAAAVGGTWWSEDATPSMVSVKLRDDSVACGQYAGTKDQTIFLKSFGGQTGVPLSAAKTVSFRQKC